MTIYYDSFSPVSELRDSDLGHDVLCDSDKNLVIFLKIEPIKL
jgi:hypothetical protein